MRDDGRKYNIPAALAALVGLAVIGLGVGILVLVIFFSFHFLINMLS